MSKDPCHPQTDRYTHDQNFNFSIFLSEAVAKAAKFKKLSLYSCWKTFCLISDTNEISPLPPAPEMK
jgi:hypothetical protein